MSSRFLGLGAGDSGSDGGLARISFFRSSWRFSRRVVCLLGCRFLGLGAGDGGSDGGLTWVSFFRSNRGRCFSRRVVRLLGCCFLGLGAGDGGSDGGFTRVSFFRSNRGRCFSRCVVRLLGGFFGFYPRQRGGHGGLTRIVSLGGVNRRRINLLLRFTLPRLRLARLAGGDGGAVIRCGAWLHLANRSVVFAAYARQRRLNGALVVIGQFDRRFFVALFTRQFLALHARLFGFVTGFGFGGARRFLIDRLDLRLLLAVILHQRNIARTYIGAGAALDAVKQIVLARLVVFLAAAEPVQLLRQQAGRTGVDAQSAADTGLFRLLRRHLIDARRQQTVADFNDRHVQRGQGEAHQRAAHHHHLLALWPEAGEFQQMFHRGADARPQVARLAQRLTGQRDHAFD